jgi:hypothetical protein
VNKPNDAAVTDLETKAYEYFNRVISDENVRFEIEEVIENSFSACVYSKCDFWIKVAANNPLTAAKRAILAYKMLKHGPALLEAANDLRTYAYQEAKICYNAEDRLKAFDHATAPFAVLEADDE